VILRLRVVSCILDLLEASNLDLTVLCWLVTMSEKATVEATPLLRGRLQQRPRKSHYSTVLGLLAAVCLITFFHHRPYPYPVNIEDPADKPWTWSDVSIHTPWTRNPKGRLIKKLGQAKPKTQLGTVL
jgi:hypothetical protein